MQNHITTDVQTAIQTQSIQTAQERNTTALTDGAFQSFLTSAPIPRLFLSAAATQAIPNATSTTLAWGGTTIVHDPYAMQPTYNNALIAIPVDGYYSFTCQTQFNINGNYAGRSMEWLTSVSRRLGAGIQLAQGAWDAGGTNFGNMNMTVVQPFNAGDSFFVNVTHNGGAAITTGGASLTWLSGGWFAPYYLMKAGVQ